MPFLDRASFLTLLKRLDGTDDADVLAAGREISKRMKDGGIGWEDLLVSAAADAEPADDFVAAAPLVPADRDEARAAIQALLTRGDIGEDTAGDLRDLLADLDRGAFGAGDLRYVRALKARLS